MTNAERGQSTAVNQGENVRDLGDDASLSRKTRELIEADADAFYHQALSTPVFNTVSKVEGAYLFDGDGRQYLDLHGNGVHTVGYNNPYILDAIRRQIDSGLTFAPRRYTNSPAVELAQKLISIAPDGLDRALFCPGGSEAIEMATMVAKHATGHWQTLSYYGTFHGAGFQAVSIGADPHFRGGLGPVMPGAIHLELPSYYRNPWGWTDEQRIDDEYIRQFALQIEYNAEIAALISEPIFYDSTVPSRYFWQSVRELCDRHGILLIFDEIYTALGRTGRMFASEHYVTPDILVVGKGFGGGILPFAGIIGRNELNVIDDRSVGHYTHEKNPLCAAVASAVIDYVLDEGLIERTSRLGEHLRQGLLALQDEFALIGDVRGLGLNLAVELVKDRVTKERAVDEAHFLVRHCMTQGVSLKLIQGNILNLKPSLVITQQETDSVLRALEDSLRLLQR